MAEHLVRKLEQFTKLSGEDKCALEQVVSGSVRQLGPRQEINHRDDSSSPVTVLLEGYAYRYKLLRNGRRSITALIVPGDMCDLRIVTPHPSDGSVGTATSAIVAEVPWATARALTKASPPLRHALALNALAGVEIQREWIVSLGQRNATERTAHLLCELFIRLQAVGLTDGQSFELPIKQVELADMLGLSPVHTNRVLQELRAQDLITLRGGTLTILNLRGLQFTGLFDPGYLQFGRNAQASEAHGA